MDNQDVLDLVYPLSNQSGWNNSELRYSLRSFVTYFSQVGRVWIVGDKPEWLTGVRHLPLHDSYKNNPDANIIQKIMRACAEADLSEDFVFVSDDMCLLTETGSEHLKPFFLQDLQAINEWWPGAWVQRIRNTYERMMFRRLPTLNYECHLPVIFNKDLFPKIMLNFDYGANPGYTITSLSFNSLTISSTRLPRVGLRAGFYDAATARSMEQIKALTDGCRFLSYNDHGLTNELKFFLEERFPDPCQFEADEEIS